MRQLQHIMMDHSEVDGMIAVASVVIIFGMIVYSELRDRRK